MDSIWVLDFSNATQNPTILSDLNNIPVCSNQDLIYQKFQDPYVIFSVISLVLLNIAIIGGNILVIVATFVSSKLRTVTNHFIVSLAVSDLLLGLTIIPYSLCLAVLDIWIFGEIWCLGWLVIDVWLSTASIMNLCAISVDRYLAVTRPVRYRSIMTSHRAKVIILFVWILSFIVSFPPLMGWSDAGLMIIKGENLEPTAYRIFTGNNIFNNRTRFCYAAQTQCVLFDDTGYVTYSALGSFFIPMSFMIFFYWRIYIVASRTTRAFKRGYKRTKKGKNSQNNRSEESLTLRIHRRYICAESNFQGSSDKTLVSPSVSDDISSEDLTTFTKSTISTYGSTKSIKNNNDYSATHLQVPIEKRFRQNKSVTVYGSPRQMMINDSKPEEYVKNNQFKGSQKSNTKTQSSIARFPRRTHTGKWQTRRLLAETKAAKTVGIIVGGFIICWFPFFTAYLIRGYCRDQSCIPHLMLTIFTWLGYANSAINPVIYGLFSRDFRRAFKRIICMCKFKEEVGVTSLIRQIHLPSLFEEDISGSIVKNESQDESN